MGEMPGVPLQVNFEDMGQWVAEHVHKAIVVFGADHVNWSLEGHGDQ